MTLTSAVVTGHLLYYPNKQVEQCFAVWIQTKYPSPPAPQELSYWRHPIQAIEWTVWREEEEGRESVWVWRCNMTLMKRDSFTCFFFNLRICVSTSEISLFNRSRFLLSSSRVDRKGERSFLISSLGVGEIASTWGVYAGWRGRQEEKQLIGHISRGELQWKRQYLLVHLRGTRITTSIYVKRLVQRRLRFNVQPRSFGHQILFTLLHHMSMSEVMRGGWWPNVQPVMTLINEWMPC